MNNQSEEKDMYMRKPLACRLGKIKFVYAREGEEEDTIIVRNLFENGKPASKVFGLKNVNDIKKLFLTILCIYKIFMNVKPKLKFVTKEQIQELLKAIEESESSLRELSTFLIDADGNNDEISFRMPVQSEFVNVKLFSNTAHPYVTMCNEDGKKHFKNAVTLFVGETIELLKYMNTRFNFTNTETLKIKTNILDYTKDNFF